MSKEFYTEEELQEELDEYRQSYEKYLTTLEEEPVDKKAFERGMEWIESLLRILPKDWEHPYLCDAFDGDMDIVWKNQYRAIVVCMPSEGDYRGALCGEFHQAAQDNPSPELILKWMVLDVD